MAGSGNAHLRDEAVLRVVDLVVEFPAKKKQVVHAVSGVSFDLDRGETLGIVGESGCGKTTTGRAVMHLEHASSGQIELNGVDLASTSGEQLRQARRAMQMIFQDPVSSLNPSRRVKDIVREGLEIWGTKTGAFREGWVEDIMESVGLGDPSVGERRPHEFSGGQCQRICIARALVMDPDVLILDEPVSALDVSVQAQILNLLESLKTKFGLTMLFISHDLAVVKNISDRVMVMYLGKVCEVAETDLLYDNPTHPYTRALLASIPGHTLDLPPASELISGELPSPLDPPSGCRFRTRCPRATERCAAEEPVLEEIEPGHWIACHHP
ncbi:ABC transporter ATP-binding protein [Ilumatobacter coccineus]|jgi:peptide/nickel transport system ATP-binding protein|uniref:Oligopeptide ABC transporter ATP-binding protein n=1 Tax=Ilumatobacter coccineus (strain NBRC 103263 / KCTC 29153 / YM16-304) TaxID=1313172 RepID=A0A6C7E8C1_ILUCY|nr:ABC transporter ATP-binding protein [Ilumatobacter coccineus]BAN03904.1 oligopeptide ABC transporter ATP-binding protein [Ilumatobacter coccineus YM16-304]